MPFGLGLPRNIGNLQGPPRISKDHGESPRMIHQGFKKIPRIQEDPRICQGSTNSSTENASNLPINAINNRKMQLTKRYHVVTENKNSKKCICSPLRWHPGKVPGKVSRVWCGIHQPFMGNLSWETQGGLVQGWAVYLRPVYPSPLHFV